MAFTSQGSTQAGAQSGNLQGLSVTGLEMPSDALVNDMPQPTPFEQGLAQYIADTEAQTASQNFPDNRSLPTPPEADVGIFDSMREFQAIDEEQRTQEDVYGDADVQAQLESERILPITERRASTAIDQWRSTGSTDPLPSADGGFKDRLSAVSNSLGYFFKDAEGAQQYVQPVSPISKASTMGKLLESTGATQPNVMTGQYVVDPMFKNILSVVTEQYFAEKASGNNAMFDPALRPLKMEESDVEYGNPEEPAATPTEDTIVSGVDEMGRPKLQVKKSDDPTRLGQEIHREYQRVLNSQAGVPTDQYTDLEPEKAALLGDFAKEIFAFSMGDKMPLFKDTTGKVVFGITEQLQRELKESKAYRSTLFQKKIVRALKGSSDKGSPSKSGKQIGEGQKYTKSVTGKIGKGRTTSKEHEEARRNQGSIPHVVDRTRLKILISTLIPSLMHRPSAYGQDPVADVLANANNIGGKKYKQFVAAAAIKNKNIKQGDEPYNPNEELRTLKNIVAQQLFGITQERSGANYLTYVIQAFNGRFTPQQSLFNPTTSKAVRFVTRNAVPSEIRKGGKNYNAALQAYALVLGIEPRGVDAEGNPTFRSIDQYEPKIRAQAVLENADTYYQWGTRLTEVMNNTMTDEEAENIAAAIANGVPLTDPNFPQVKRLALDPEKDSILLSAIAEKGEDGNTFIDGLMDFVSFKDAMDAGIPHYSYLNATIDGKTNGPASNALQMGDYEGALRTGVIRTADQVYAVQDDEDIRDVLKNILMDQLDAGFTGHYKDPVSDGVLFAVAKEVFGTRDLNKKITMTFGYGKEIESFVPEVIDTIYLAAENNPAMRAALDYIEDPQTELTLQDVAQNLVNAYIPAVKQVMSADGIESRRMMWGVALVNAMSNTAFEIIGPTGMRFTYGGKMADEFLTDRLGTYKVKGREGGENVAAYKYGSSPTSAAPKKRIMKIKDPETNQMIDVEYDDFGGRAWGGSIPGPVQALDAATVVKTFSGDSWKRISKAAGGKPYIHQVYDAFKFDINSFERGYLEVNNNWANAALDWSYLEQAEISMAKAVKHFEAVVNSIGKTANLDDFPMIKQLLTPNSDGEYVNLFRKMKSLAPDHAEGEWPTKATAWLAAKYGDSVNFNGEIPTEKLIGFYKEIISMTKLPNRLHRLYNKTEEQKKKLRPLIFDPNNTIMQYHAH